MNVTYTEAAKRDAEGYALLQQATRKLEEVLGEHVDAVTATWDRGPDEANNPVYTIHLKDSFGDVTRPVKFDELQERHSLSFRLHRAWGDLLGVRMRKLIEQMQSGD